MTLREIVDQNPDWLDYEVVVGDQGYYSYVGASGDVYPVDEYEDQETGPALQTGRKILVFVGN